MTQIQHVTDKEMTRRTGVTNALGYTFPEKDLILLKKGLAGKQKREVLDHEINHLKNGEEGPFLGAMLGAAGIGALGSILGGQAAGEGTSEAAKIQARQAAQARGDLTPYREFGASQLGNLQNWLSQSGYGAQEPTMAEVQASPGYASRLGAIENSAAAKGSLFSGNALRNIGEFGSSEFANERARRQQQYQQELANRLGLVNLGQSSAAGSANIAQNLGTSLGNIAMQGGQNQANMYGDIAGNIAGGLGAYAGQQQWNDFLNRAYPKAGA